MGKHFTLKIKNKTGASTLITSIKHHTGGTRSATKKEKKKEKHH